MPKKISDLLNVSNLLQAAKVVISQIEDEEAVAKLATITQLAQAISTNLSLASTYATDLYYDEEAGKLYAKAGNDLIGEGVDISNSGLAFDEIIVETVDDIPYLHIKNAGIDVVDPCQLPQGGGGGGTITSVVIQNGMSGKNINVIAGRTCLMKYSWDSYLNGSSSGATGTATWYVGGVAVAVQSDITAGSKTFDITPYLAPDANTVKLTIDDSYGATRSFTWSVTVSAYTVTWNLDDLANHFDESLMVRVTVSGTGSKTVKFAIDGTTVETVPNVGTTASYTVPAQTHGAHVITAWMEVTVGGESVTSETLKHTGVWTESGTTTPIIAVATDEIETPQYSTTPIKWMAYSPVSDTLTVEKYEDGVLKSTETVGSTVQTWAYKGTEVGDVTLKLKTGSTEQEIDVTVTSLGYDINPVTAGLVLDLDPTGHTNTEQGYDTFGYKDGSDVNHPLTFSSNFDWINGGFQLDGDGVTALLIKRGTYVQFDRSFFNDNARTNGKEIKIVFKVTECRDYDTEILTCYANNIGLKLKANEGELFSSGTSRVIPYCEDSKLEMDVNIEAASENRVACVWLEGIPSRFLPYDTDEWQQISPEAVKIGSDDCDVWLYRVKMYSNSLTRQDVLQNFIADCADAEDMIARYLRNDIYTNNELDIAKIVAANPTLRVFNITAAKMTTSKSDEVSCRVRLDYGADPTRNFTAQGVTMKAQGTSSLEYILSALNLDLDFKNATSWVDDEGTAITSYSYDPAVDIPVKYFNLKLNVASSENANNACIADDYNTYQPNITKLREDNPKVRDTCHGYPCAVFFTNNSGSAITVGSRTVQNGQTILYGNGDLMNSKKNYETFGQISSYSDLMCVEIGNNNNPQCLFQSDDLSTETWDGDERTSNFEFRYPKSPTATHKAAWQTLLSWVVSTDRENAPDTALPEPVTIDGVEYEDDTAEYRAAKFKAEVEDHFNLDSLLYHYLFTERHLMVDNRAKNTFCSYEPDTDGVYRWNFNKDYDNDTADGNDNSGGLTFTYGLEDTDQVGASDVFNAADSVLWCNVRDLFGDELVAMYKNRRAAGAWNAARFLAKMEAYQAARPEALVAQDMYGKYYTPYTNSGQVRYMNMMYGNKTDQRRQFERYQEQYMDAKYIDLTDRSNTLEFRLNAPQSYTGVEPSGDIVGLVPYVNTYLNVMFGNAGTARVRATRGQTYTLECPPDAVLNDLETYVFGASWLSKIGSMAALYTKFVDSAAAIRIQELLIGSGETGYANTGLTASSGGVSVATNVFCEKLDLRGLPNLETSLNMSNLKALKEIYLGGSGITGVTFADGCPLTKAQLGNNLRSLYIHNVTTLTEFIISATKLTSVNIEGCNAYVDTQSICEDAVALARGRITGVNWSMTDADLLNCLSRLAGYDAHGNISDHFVLTGSASVTNITQAELTALAAAFPDLTITYTNIVDSYDVTFKNYDDTVLYTETVRSGGRAYNPLGINPATGEQYIATPTKPSTVGEVFTFSGWDVSFLNITEDTVVTAVFSSATRQYTVRWFNGADLLQTSVVDAFDDATYTGSEPVPETGFFMGWSASTINVQADTDTFAKFCVPVIPETYARGYDYLYSDDPTDNSGYTREEFVGILNAKRGKDFFTVGDKIKICPDTNVFTDTEIVLRLIGYNHYKETGTNTFAHAVFEMVGVMDATKAHRAYRTSANAWQDSLIRAFLNDDVYPALPVIWQKLIKSVDVLGSVGGGNTTDFLTTSDKLFILSEAEVGHNTGVAQFIGEIDADAEEMTFSVYTDNSSRIKRRLNGAGDAVNYWTRSPAGGADWGYLIVGAGGTGGGVYANESYSVAFGFCI